MLFSKKGVELLEKYGGHHAADFYRRNYDSGDTSDQSKRYLKEMVALALVQMAPERFVQVLTRLGDAEAALKAFFVFGDADTPTIGATRAGRMTLLKSGLRHPSLDRESFSRTWELLRSVGATFPHEARERWKRRRLRRYNDAYREMLIRLILSSDDKALIRHVREMVSLFTEDERALLRGGLRAVKAA